MKDKIREQIKRAQYMRREIEDKAKSGSFAHKLASESLLGHIAELRQIENLELRERIAKSNIFEIDINRIIDTDIPVILRDFHEILLVDNEPTLFCGLNAYNGRIIGSLVDIDRIHNIKRYFHTLIDNETFDNYLNRQITYFEILSKSNNTFAIDKNIDNDQVTIYRIDISDIPNEYLPPLDSYSPESKSEPTFEYSLRLKGQKAEKNSAIPKTVSRIQNAFGDILENAIRALSISFSPCAIMRPYQPSSFKLHFLIEATGQLPAYGFGMYQHYLLAHITYLLNYIHEDLSPIFKTESVDPDHFNSLLSIFRKLYSHKMNLEDSEYKNILISHLNDSLSRLSEIADSVGSGFDYITISSVSNDNRESPIGKIDRAKSDEIRNSIDVIDQYISDVQVDDFPNRYDIVIYHLNTDSRKGNAQIRDTEDSLTYSKPSIKITGPEPLEGTKYTESLHLNKIINILGKSKKVNGKFRHIEILYE